MRSRRCKTSYGSGKKKAFSLGRFILLSTLITCPFKAAWGIERSQWTYSHWGTPPAVNTTRQVGYLFQGSLQTAGNSYSAGGQITWDARYFELSSRFTQQQFAANASRPEEDSTLSVELARRYLSSDGRYGRLGLEYYWLKPGEARTLRIGINTGIFENADKPFVIRVDTSFFIPVTAGQNSLICAGLEAGYVLSHQENQTWRIGGLLNWTYRLQPEQTLTSLTLAGRSSLRDQHMIFALGPWTEFATKNFNARLSLLGRIWLDKRWTVQGGPTVPDYVLVSYPSSFIDPGVQFSASYLF